MYVNSVRNNSVYSFKANENEAVEIAAKQKEENTGAPVVIQQPENDNFTRTVPEIPQSNASPNGAMSFLTQINKMQKTQKIIGGTLFGVGVLGALSFLSPKKWVRGLFAIPAGGVLAFFGANMLNSAKALDKIKDITTAQPGQ